MLKLSDEQRDAIKYDGHVLIDSCPGSGKTRTLIGKIKYELEKKESRRRIAAITFTNKAADEIIERLEHLDLDLERVWVGTIHSFCLHWILRPYHFYSSELKEGFAIMPPREAEARHKEVIRNNIQKFKNNRYAPRLNFKALCQPNLHYSCDSGGKLSNQEEKKVAHAFYNLLLEEKRLTFELMLFFSFKLLNNKPVINDILSSVFSQILVDEYQDTNKMQYEILGKIINAGGGKTRLFMVGDPNQAIYSSLGGIALPKGDIEAKIGGNLKSFKLDTNYRSSEKIINYYQAFQVSQMDLNAGAKEELKLYESYIVLERPSNNGDALIDCLVSIINFNLRRSISQNEICIAAPWWVHLGPLATALRQKLKDVNFISRETSPIGKDVENIWYKISRLILTKPSVASYFKRLRWASQILVELNDIGLDIQWKSNRSFLKYLNSISVSEVDGLEHLQEYFRKIVEYSGGDSIDNWPVLEGQLTSFKKDVKYRTNKIGEKWGYDDCRHIDFFRSFFEEKSGILLSTCHGIKGLEFDTMIVFGALDGFIPHGKDKDAASAKRMMYVLASRARKNLFLLGAKYFEDKERSLSPVLEEYNYEYSALPPTP